MEGDQSTPIWMPDGSHLVFSSLVKGTRGLFSISSDGNGPARPLNTMKPGRNMLYPSSVAPDGTLVISYQENTWLVSPDAKVEPQSVTPGIEAEFSADGRWLASVQRGPGQSQVYVQPYPAIGRREQVSTGERGSGPAWRRDGRELYYVEYASGDGPLNVRVMAVPITTTPVFSPDSPRVLFEGPFRIDGPFRGYDVTPDGQRFLMVREVPQQPARVSQMVLVQNWFEELKQRVPTK
jgi:Tol biopolymer transport system component